MLCGAADSVRYAKDAYIDNTVTYRLVLQVTQCHTSVNCHRCQLACNMYRKPLHAKFLREQNIWMLSAVRSKHCTTRATTRWHSAQLHLASVVAFKFVVVVAAAAACCFYCPPLLLLAAVG